MTPRGERYPWAKFGNPFMTAQSMNLALPAWQRVAFAGWASVPKSGIARFDPGQLAELCAIGVNPRTGEAKSTAESVKHEARAAVRRAVAEGWLVEGSTVTALVVDPDVLGVGVFRPVSVHKLKHDDDAAA